MYWVSHSRAASIPSADVRSAAANWAAASSVRPSRRNAWPSWMWMVRITLTFACPARAPSRARSREATASVACPRASWARPR